MDCNEARLLLLDRRKKRLDEATSVALDGHLAGCDACRAEDAADEALSAALARLPRRGAPAALKRSLRARWSPRRELFLGALVAAAIVLAVALAWRSRASTSQALAAEAVNDHLRILYSEHPLEVESGGVHQVKPWFAGRLDFAPTTAFGGDEDFPLQGGAIAYFLDRKAAAYEFKRRLHPITLLVFRAEGLPWPAGARTTETMRGFHVILWRGGDLGYALVSDLDPVELGALAAKVGP